MLQQMTPIEAPATGTPTPTGTPTADGRAGARARSAASEAAMIDRLPLSEQQKDFLRYRWLDQVTWMERDAKSAQRWYSLLRVIAIVGAVLVPTLVSLTLTPEADSLLITRATIFIGLLVAISTAVEEFFHFGQKWRHYRHNAERLKSEGWQFFALTGPYLPFATHDGAYRAFAGHVEEVFERETDVYISEIVLEKPRGRDQGAAKPGDQPPGSRG